MRALDLFCGGGGAASCLQQAGFDVDGVDADKRHGSRYPGRFIEGDATRIAPDDLGLYDLVWASPPCQRWSKATSSRGKGARESRPDLISPTRSLLAHHRAWVIENVPGAPIYPDIKLTGPMVGLTRIERLRYFEVSPWIRERICMQWAQPPVVYLTADDWSSGRACTITKSLCSTSHYYRRKAVGLPGRIPRDEAAEVMGISHYMTCDEIGEAVPPPYALYVANVCLIAFNRGF